MPCKEWRPNVFRIFAIQVSQLTTRFKRISFVCLLIRSYSWNGRRFQASVDTVEPRTPGNHKNGDIYSAAMKTCTVSWQAVPYWVLANLRKVKVITGFKCLFCQVEDSREFSWTTLTLCVKPRSFLSKKETLNGDWHSMFMLSTCG